MKKYIIPILIVAMGITNNAHSQKKDTVVLAMYNNNQMFMLYPMPFGKNKPDNDFVSEMVLALDTVNILQTATQADTSDRYPKRWITQRQCGKKPMNVKDKVALLYLNKDCDISTQVLNAQEAGALAVVMIHPTDNKDSVSLTKKVNTFPYANDNKVKIPCFTVRKGIGERLTQILPSLVGIKRPKEEVPTALAMDSTAIAAKRDQAESVAKTDTKQETPPTGLDYIGWAMSPNPAHTEALLQYNFDKMATLRIEVFNEIGQLVTNYQLPDTQTGNLRIDVSGWSSGTYNISLNNGTNRDVKRMIVVH